MCKLIIGGDEVIVCDKVVKGDDYVYCYVGNNIEWAFEGVTEFDGYVLEEGEFSKPEPSRIEVLEAKVEMLIKMLAEKEG